MTRVSMIGCDTCKKKCDDGKHSYYQLSRYDYIDEDFIEEALKQDKENEEDKEFKTVDWDDLEVHFCSLECLKKYVKGMEK